MGKKRLQTRQVRQMRQVRQRVAPPPAPASQRKQRERYVQAGGMLQGYAPELVQRIGHIAAAGAAACLLIGALLLLFLPGGWPVRAVAAGAWVVPIVLATMFIVRGYQLARKDRRAEPNVVQGQLVGASEVSTSLGLGMLMLKTRGGGNEQYLVAPEKLAKVPGNQVTVMLTVTPNLRHVRSVGVMGQRMMPRPQPPVPPVLKQLRLLPIITPAALAAAAIVGDDAVSLVPLRPDWAHAIVAGLAGGLLVLAVLGASQLIQRRLTNQVQALMPGGLQ
ncbi:MAG TPA: hypothetical protein VKF59_06515 [Candidatus Dormibacteraeota bacterium]|nr:hypothetical protein [Candidatus Dormibacteraeota bacterium]